jgi:hypothetical protein
MLAMPVLHKKSYTGAYDVSFAKAKLSYAYKDSFVKAKLSGGCYEPFHD